MINSKTRMIIPCRSLNALFLEYTLIQINIKSHYCAFSFCPYFSLSTHNLFHSQGLIGSIRLCSSLLEKHSKTPLHCIFKAGVHLYTALPQTAHALVILRHTLVIYETAVWKSNSTFRWHQRISCFWDFIGALKLSGRKSRAGDLCQNCLMAGSPSWFR